MLSQMVSRVFRLLGPTDDLFDPLWNVRLCPLVCAIFFLLAETIWRTGKVHPIILAMGWVQLPTLSIAMFRAKDILIKGSVLGKRGRYRAIWSLRLLPLLCAASILGAEFLRIGDGHAGLLGFSAGILTVLLIIGFSTTAVLPSEAQQRDDLQRLHLTQ